MATLERASLWLILAALAGVGCSYLSDRARDAGQVVSVDAGVGYGLAADVGATDLMALGLGGGRSWRAGLWEGRAATWQELALHLPAGFLFGPVDAGPFYSSRGPNYWPLHQLLRGPTRATRDSFAFESSMLVPAAFGRSSDRRRWTDRLRLDVGVLAGGPGVRFRFDLGQLLDLLAGLATLDPAGDDRGRDPPPESGQWLAGDCHAHFNPPDDPGHAHATLDQTLAMARQRGLDFVFLTPHLWTAAGDAAYHGARIVALEPDLLVAVDGDQAIVFHDDQSPGWRVHDLAELGRRRSAVEARHRSAAGDPADWRWESADWPDVVAEVVGRRRLLGIVDGFADLSSDDLLVVGGFEVTLATPGHVGVAFHDPGRITGHLGSAAVNALEGGGLTIIEHPFSLPIPIPRFSILHVNLGWDPWLPEVLTAAQLEELDSIDWRGPLDRARADVEVWGAGPAGVFRKGYSGAEAYNSLRHLLETALVADPDEWTIHRTFRRLAADALSGRRRLIATGGSDNHRHLLHPTTWVRVEEKTLAGLEAGLRAGRIVLVRPDATSFRARSDATDAWHGIGDDLAADRRVELSWSGTADLYVDGAFRGRYTGGAIDEIEPGTHHVYRIVLRGSYSNFIYVNFEDRPDRSLESDASR